MSEKLPGAVRDLMGSREQLWDAYSKLGEEVAHAGPLDERARRLVKLALAIGCGSEGAVHSHVRRARAEGCSDDEIHHVAILAIPTLGLPRAMAARTWINDILKAD